MQNKTKLFSLIAFIFPLLINGLQVITTWIPQESWYLEWGKYIHEGQIPYKDFYLPFPPLLIYINSLFFFSSNPLVASHIFYWIVMGFLGWGLFKVSAQITDQRISLLISTSLVLFWSIHPTDVIGGFFEFAVTLVTWGYFLVFQKKNNCYLQVIGGTLIAMGSLVKQNFLATIVALTFYLCIRFLLRQKTNSRVTFALIGSYGTYLVFALILILNQSFNSFVDAMLDGGGKNPTLNTWFRNLFISNLRPSVLLACLLLLAGLFVVSRFKNSPKQGVENYLFLLFGASLISASISIFMNFSFDIVSIKNIVQTLLLFFLVALVAILQSRKRRLLSYILIGLIVSSTIHIYLDFFVSQFDITTNQDLFTTSYIYSIWNYIGATVWFFVSIVIAVSILTFTRLAKLVSAKKLLFLAEHRVIILSLFSADVLNAFNGGLALDGSVLLAAIVLSVVSININVNGLIYSLIAVLLTIGLILSSAIISRVPYQWYYWNELKTVNVSNNIPLFKGMYLTGAQTEFYEEIHRQLILGSQIVNNPKPIVISIPAQPTLSWLRTGFYENSYYLRCPIIWIDICPEHEAEETFAKIQSQTPDMIVFFDLGAKGLVDLERGYRNGKISTLSRIREYLLNGQDYRILKTFKTAGNSANVFVFVRKNNDF